MYESVSFNGFSQKKIDQYHLRPLNARYFLINLILITQLVKTNMTSKLKFFFIVKKIK